MSPFSTSIACQKDLVIHHFTLIYRFVGFTRCKVLLILLMSIAALLLATVGGSEVGAVAPGFAAKQDFGTGAGPFYLAVGDFNNDGKPDVAVTNSSSASVSVLVNTTTPGATSFSFAPKQDFFPGANPWGVAAADFNGDGMLDLAVASSSSNNVAVFLNTTTPGSSTLNFGSPQTFPTGTTPRGIKAGDFNLDGLPDLAVVNSASGVNSVSVLLNTATPGAATPSFAAKQDLATGANPVNVALGDLNGDGKLDIAVNNSSDHTVSVFINFTPAGTLNAMFFPKQDFTRGNGGPTTITMGDLNGDGKLDIVTDSGDSSAASVLFNTTVPGSSTAGFVAAQNFTLPPFYSIVASDLNGDGRMDLAGTDPLTNAASVFPNNTAPGSTTANFGAKQTFPAGTSSAGIDAGDFNGDGQPDLVVANGNSNTLSIFRNTTVITPATPGFTVKQDFVAGVNPRSAAMGDLNGDGKRDLVVTNGTFNVSVLRNNGAVGAASPSFAAKQDFSTSGSPASVAIGDLNNDGVPDLAVATGSNKVSVLLNTTAPGATTLTFAAKQDFSTGGSVSLVLADLNRDGRLDLICANNSPGSNAVSVLLNTTPTGVVTPSFALRQEFVTGSAAESVAVVDCNGDGRLDLAVVNVAGPVSVLLNTTAPGATTASFAPKQDFGVGTTPGAVAAADLNGDGMPDLAVANGGSNSVSILLNTTTPGSTTLSFTVKQDFATGNDPRFISPADLNGDGKVDLAIANNSSATVSVLLNTTSPGNTVPNFAGKQDFGAGNGPLSVAAGDLNGDGKPDLLVASTSGGAVAVLLNTPTIVAASGLSRQQSTPAINSQIANVTNYGGDSSVVVSVTSANPANGVTISNIVNTNGNVTADIAASCGASNASFTLQATDGSSIVTSTLSVAVTANSPPTLTYPTPQSAAFSGSLNVNPTTASDNGSITGYSVFSVSPALTSAPTVNASGVVSITNARPAGSHVITIRATDNCGATADAPFTLDVQKASTSTGINSSLNPSALGQSVTFTATVTSVAGTPTGTVQFKIDGSNVGSPVTLNGSGAAQLATSSLTAATHTVTADYGGDANFNSSTGTLAGGQVVNNRPLISLNPATYNVSESSGFVTITVIRSGDTSPAVKVDYSTSGDNGLPCSTANGVATPKCDFTTATGTLNFASGETNKTITIPISQDSFVEGPETFSLALSNATAGTGIATPATASISIGDDATEPPTNVIDDARNFVRQQYHDFLNREPDASGWDFWTGEITSCGNDAACTEVKRINVSAAFFVSIEFQQTGYLVERIYKTSYGDATATSQVGGSHQIFVPVVRANELLTDTQRVGRGVVVNQPGWETVLENNKQAYALEFVQTARFVSAYPTTMTSAAFVSALNQNAGNVLSPTEFNNALNTFGPPPAGGSSNNVTARAQVLRQIAEDQDLYNAEFNRAFVLTEFIGYLRRNPNDLPDTDYTGYDFWLGKLNQFNGDYIAAEMVKAFISSSEFRQRFGSN